MSRHEYCVTLADMQTLQRLRHRLLRSSLTLSSCLDNAAKLEKFCDALDELGLTPKSSNVGKAIHAYSLDIERHQQSANILMDTLKGTLSLVSIVPHLLTLVCGRS